MSGSDKMEVDDGPPPVVVVDQGQDANIYCTPPIPIHKNRNKKFAAHRQHNATSVRHITQLFPLGRLGVRSHNFCEVPTSGGGVLKKLY